MRATEQAVRALAVAAGIDVGEHGELRGAKIMVIERLLGDRAERLFAHASRPDRIWLVENGYLSDS
jgi:hypothetical protein